MDVLWQDAAVMVVNKPSGLLTSGPANVPTLEAMLQDWLATHAANNRDDAQRSIPFIRLPHRLDRPVSGALVIARTASAAKLLSAQFQTRKVEKHYWAMVRGCVGDDTGRWTDTMRKVPGQARAELLDAGHSEAKAAVLLFRVLQRWSDRTLLEIQLQTGRMHQIRLQAASRGHAILGDKLYGSDQSFGPAVDDPRGAAIALHARRIGFRHPKTAAPITVEAPLPAYWEQK